MLSLRWACGLITAASFGLSACGSGASKANTTASREQQVFNRSLADTFSVYVHSCDIVLRRGRGPQSDMLAALNLRDKSWSHCGFVVIENGVPFVYHSIGGEDNPDARLRRDSLPFFISPERNAAVAIVRYSFDSTTQNTVLDNVKTFYSQRPKFDLKFDLATDSALYCSEFVYKVVTRSCNDTGYIPLSYGYGRRFVGIDDLFLNPHATIVRKVNYK